MDVFPLRTGFLTGSLPQIVSWRKGALVVFGLMQIGMAEAHLIGEESGTAAPHYHDGAKPPPVKKGEAVAAPQKPKLPEAIFLPFAPEVATHADADFFYVESNGLPAHRMMVGITAWQQQVPLPQSYRGDNAWRFPLRPVVAADPLLAKTHFFRGAIALAANGVPIFNPIKNDGRTDTFLAGELDEFGGHAGRADDYHYHIAPVHLQEAVGGENPVAYALDGYAIYGYAEPDGSPVSGLDSLNGHATPALGYHYHATKGYPYLNGGFHGEVTEREGQVDPQPRAQGVRMGMPPLRGAKITDFARPGPNSFSLTYEIGAEIHQVNYEVGSDKSVQFSYIDGDGRARVEEYVRPPDRDTRPGGKPRDAAENRRQPWIKVHAKEMDLDGDGILTAGELTAEVEKVHAGYDKNGDGKILPDEYGEPVRSPMGGFVKQHASEIDRDGDGAITKEELLALADKMISKADSNGDGRLTADELTLPSGYQANPPAPPRP